jgi:mono/diheme cytochrome c family protein
MHLRPAFLILAFAALASARAADALPPSAARPVDFVRDIKPLFEASCVKCHAKGKNKGGFSLETREAFLKGGETGPAAVAGKSGESYVVGLVAGTDADLVMPKKGTKWTAEQVGLLRAWIDQGLPWDASITFAKPPPQNLRPRTIALPGPDGVHPVDRILTAYFNEKGITPASPVPDHVFARRAWLDAVGLLPRAEELSEFLANPAPDKRAALVRRLLNDRRGYADHWLTFWNDLLRNDYKGTGFIDGGRKQISRWLYSALLDNVPYDRFVAELVNPSKLSEGFTKGIIWRGAVNASMQPPMQAAQNISQVFMGVNLKCASCHDSFINDWALADAYGLAAIYSEKPLELVHCDKPTGQRATVRFLYPEVGTLDAALAPAARLQRLSEILTSRDNGRLSRTIVNRFWARLFGRGLVASLDDMEQPAWNRDLLDWLAEDLVAHRFDLKRTIELLMTSTAYQLPTVEALPEKERFTFRGPFTRRLTAEQLADALTSFTGKWARMPASLEFDFTTAGGPVARLMPQWIWTEESPAVATQREAARAARQQLDLSAKKIADARAAADRAAGNDIAALKEARTGIATANAALEAAQAALSAERTEPAEVERHKVVFRKKFVLSELPKEAFAAVLASQRFDVKVNDKEAKPIQRDGAHNGRIVLLDLARLLLVGENTIAIDVSSHTEKQMNDNERKAHPASANHLNTQSGLAFYLRCIPKDEGKEPLEIVTDASWRVRRNPDGASMAATYADADWAVAKPLADGVTPVDEGPGLPPITREDFANLPVELGPQLRPVVSIVINPGGIRASLLAADPLQLALDRPNREQVMPVRATAATTLQALELTNGATLDNQLKQTAETLLEKVKKDPDTWLHAAALHALGKPLSDERRAIAREMLGDPVTADGIADFLWSLFDLPECQLRN